jgi:SAM-dependent methyltransferase
VDPVAVRAERKETEVTVHQGYALSNAWELARRRLALLEACHDAASVRRAAALGVGPGWRCLDAGAGGGSFARWLAARVGPDGSVVAVDLDVRLLEEIEAPNLEVRQMDLAVDDLPGDGFDFVHTRLVLLHIAERERVLRRLVDAVRPGGILMLEEDDIFPVLAAAEGPYRAAWQAFLGVMQGGGTNPEWARLLPERLDPLGLVEVEAEVDAQFFRGGSEPAQFWSLTWEQVRERMDGGVVDAGQAVLEDPARWFYGPAKVVAWGRRPVTPAGRA